MSGIVLAVDGGNSKTDLALVRADGAAALARARARRARRTISGSTAASTCSPSLLDEAAAEAGLQRANGAVADVAELLLAGVDFPDEEQRARGTRCGARLGSPDHGPQRHLRSPPRRHRARLGRRGRLRRGDQLRRASRPTAATRASPRSARSPATGAAATTSASPPCRPPPAARTAAARRRASSRRCPRTSASTTPTELAEAIHRRRDRAAPRDRARAARARGGGDATRSPPRSSTGSSTRSSRWRAWR